MTLATKEQQETDEPKGEQTNRELEFQLRAKTNE